MFNKYKGIIGLYLFTIITVLFVARMTVFPNYNLSRSDIKYLQSLETIIAVGDKGYPPFGFKENGAHFGYEKDLMEALSEELGIEIIYRPMVWAEAKQSLEKGEAHIITGMRITPERKEKFNFTNPYLHTYFSMISLNEAQTLDDFIGQRVVVQEGSQTISVIEGIEVAELIKVPTSIESLQLLKDGMADIWIENHQVASFYINRDNLQQYSIEPLEGDFNIIPISDTRGEHAIGVGQEYSDLTAILDKALASLEREDFLSSLDIKWFGGTMARRTGDITMWAVLLVSIFLFVTVVSLLAIYNETLRYKVREKTKELEEQNTKLRNFTLNTAHALGATIEFKDIYTGGHSQRVAEISSTIGQRIGLSKENLFKLYLGARIHDIGKVGIPDEILQKPGRLTENEYKLMKEHPQIGESILSHIDGYEVIREIVLYHHERFDGKIDSSFGAYPGKVKGEDIPIEARIVSIADAYDAMTSDRPYRKALTKEEARERIKANSGKQFDPSLVKVFLKILDEHGDI